MQNLLERIWREDRGVLTFEWVLLITVLVIGIVGGYSAVRDALVDEMGDIADATLAVDQSFLDQCAGWASGAGQLGRIHGR